jgi:DNA replication protein DnaC
MVGTMDSQPTTEALDPAAVASAEGMETLGSALSLSYSETAGTCPREGCGAVSPGVVIGDKTLSLPCLPHAREMDEAEAREERDGRAARWLSEAGSWDRIRSWSLDTYRVACDDADGRAALAVAERWLDGYYRTGAGSNLVLYGPVGSGKTGLAWSMVRDLCEHGVEAKIVNFRTLLEQMKDAYSEHVSVRKWIAAYFRAPVVCFDDLGSEVPTKWARDQLLGLVDARYERGLPSIFISNYALGDLGKRIGHDDEIIGKRIVSRMSDGATKHEVAHEDRRIAA